MKRYEHISTGSVIDIATGELEVTSYNGSIAYCLERTFDADGILESEEDRMLTLDEIAHLMKEIDGKNHYLIYEEE